MNSASWLYWFAGYVWFAVLPYGFSFAQWIFAMRITTMAKASINNKHNMLRKKRLREDDDEMSTISFGALSSAQDKLRREQEEQDSDSSSDSDSGPEETTLRPRKQLNAKKNKHAPSESSAKKPVSRIREIPGLDVRNDNHVDIRFDAAYGKADLASTRRNYAFLDEYRAQEIAEMERMVKDTKSAELLSESEMEELKLRLQSLKSRVDAMKNKDFESKILAEHKKKQMQNVKSGVQSNTYFLKKSEQRRLIQKAKYDSMKASQRKKVMERKRKKRLGKEFRRMEYDQGPK